MGKKNINLTSIKAGYKFDKYINGQNYSKGSKPFSGSDTGVTLF